MHTMTCSVPGMGQTSAGKEPRHETLASEYMSGQWSPHAFVLSHDGQRCLVHRRDGFELISPGGRTEVKADVLRNRSRECFWSPDSQKVLMWAPQTNHYLYKRVAVLDTSKLAPGTVIDTIATREANAPWEVIYDAGQAHKVEGPREDKEVVAPEPYGFEWAPPGDAVFVLERLYFKHDPQRESETRILRVDLPERRITELVRMSGEIDFFMPPVSRFEHGQGPSRRPYRIVFGHREGLFLLDPRPARQAAEPRWRRIHDLPAQGLKNVEWNPGQGPDQLLLYFKTQGLVTAANTVRGVALVHLEQVGRGEGWLEQLYDGDDEVHTLWFSPHGAWATWATSTFAAYRRPAPEAGPPVRIVCRDEDGRVLPVKGLHWHADERHLAITAGARLFVHDAQKGETRQVARLGEDDERDFLAEPRWVGDKVYLSRFEDVRDEAKAWREVPHLHLPPRRRGN